jgi:hypothetical protein
MSTRLPAINVRREAIMVALVAAEVSWASAGFLALGKSAARHQPLLLWLGFFVLLLGFSYIYRALDQANISLRLRQTLLLVALLLSVVLIFRFHLYVDAGLQGFDWFLEPLRQFADLSAAIADDVIAVFTLLFLWARGIHLARRSLSVEAVGFSFRSGVIIFMWVALPAKLFTDTDVASLIPPYFFFALVAVALARVESVSREPGSRRAAGSSFWIGSAVIAVGLVVLLGLVVAAFFSGGGLTQVLVFLSPLLVLVDVIIVIFAYLIFGLLELILSLFTIDLSGFRRLIEEGLRDLRIGENAVPFEIIDEAPMTEVLGTIQAGITIAIIAVVIALVLLFTWWRARRDQDDREDESRESLLSAGALAESLLDMLRSGRNRLGQMAGMVDRFGLGSRLLSAISIQRIYANLVRLATRAGYPRVKAQTPYEYLAVLSEAWPESVGDVTLITDAYVSAHYGQVPDTREELQRIRKSWERVRARAK